MFTYLAHFYKLKFVTVTIEKLTHKFLNAYSDAQYYQDDRSVFLKSFFDFVSTELQVYKKINGINIFEPVFYETVHKVLLFFLRQLLGIVQHEKFDMPVLYINLLMNELSSFTKQWKSFARRQIKAYGFEEYTFNIFVRFSYLRRIVNDICDSLMKRILNYIDPVIFRHVQDINLQQPDFKDLFKALKEEEGEIGAMNPELSLKFETLEHDLVLETLTKRIISKSEADPAEYIHRLNENFALYVEQRGSRRLDDQIIYLQQLSVFFTDSSSFRCQNALAVIQQLLSFKLSKQTLLQLIEKKQYPTPKNFKAKLQRVVTEHFEDYQKFADRLEFHRKARKKLVVFMNCIIFIVKFKLKQSRRGLLRQRTGLDVEQKQYKYMNQPIELDYNELRSGVPVKFQIMSPDYLKQKYKKRPLSAV